MVLIRTVVCQSSEKLKEKGNFLIRMAENSGVERAEMEAVGQIMSSGHCPPPHPISSYVEAPVNPGLPFSL